MVKKEDLLDWFKNLHPRKRLDYMCSLLHMCLPLELRFIGTVLEDLARKDFHHLRDAEIKANQRNDLSNNPTNNIDDAHLRNKISIALALMNSTNSSCADIIFRILESQIDGVMQLIRNKDIADQFSLILTMAVYHPAFKFYQRNRLGEILQLVLNRIRDQFGDDDDAPIHISPPQHLEPYAMHSPVSPYSSHSPVPDVPEKVTVKSIKVVSGREDQTSKRGGIKREDSLGRRGCPEYEIHTTWSNGDVTQIFMKFKQLQDLHHKVLNKFPENKEKRQRTIPVFPGTHSHRSEPLKVQIESLNSYLSQLTKTPTHVLNCDILHTALKNGPVIQPTPPPPQPAIKSPLPVSPQSGLHSVFTQASPLHEDYHQYAISSSYRAPVCDNPAILTNSVCSSDPSHLSSSTNSPANSRTSSPAPPPPPLAPHPGKSGLASPVAGKPGSAGSPGVAVPATHHQHHQHQGSNIELSLNQLLCLLNLENYSDNLKEFSFKQILSMSIEDYSKAGLPVEAQQKLRTKLDQLKLTSSQGRNGIINKPPGLPPLPPPVQQSQHPPAPEVAQAAVPAAPTYQYPYVQLSPGHLTYVGPPVSSFPHHPHHHPHILPYHHHIGQPAPVIAANSLMPSASSSSSSSAANNSHSQQQQQQQQQLPLSTSMTLSQHQDLLTASPDFNSEASSPPASPHQGQEVQVQQHQGSGSSTSSSSDGGVQQPAPVVMPLMFSAPANNNHPVVQGSGGGSSGGAGAALQQQLPPAPLRMMSPPAAVAADTLTPAEVKQLKGKSQQLLNQEGSGSLEDDDVRPGFQDPTVSSKAKGPGQQQPNPAVVEGLPVLANVVPGAGEDAVMIMSGGNGPSPLLPADILVRTDGTPPPPPTALVAVSSQSSAAVLANGYLSDTPLPLHQPPALIGRTVHTLPRLGGYKLAAQPTHTASGLHNVIKMPGPDLPPALTAKNGSNGGGSGLIPHPAYHHSYMPPPVVGPPNNGNNNNSNSNNIMTSSSGANSNNNSSSIQLISQPPPLPPPANNDGSYPSAVHPLVFAHNASQQQQQHRGILTSVAGSSSVISTTPAHGQPGHAFLPGCCDGGLYLVHTGDGLPGEPPSSTAGDNRHGSPPSQTPPQVGSVKAQSHSSTPSPPLVSTSGGSGGGVKTTTIMPGAAGGVVVSSSGTEPVALRAAGGGGAGGSAQHMLPYYILLPTQNGMVQQQFYHHHHHHQQTQPPPPPPPPPAAFPNGMGPDHFLRPLAPQFTAGGQIPPNFYGNSVYPPHHHHHHQQHQHHLQQQLHHHNSNNNNNSSNSSGGNHQGRNTGSPASVGNPSVSSHVQGKSVCYNCGQPGHRAADCKESTMENMSNSYRLNFEPKADPQ